MSNVQPNASRPKTDSPRHDTEGSAEDMSPTREIYLLVADLMAQFT
jgi:hypothetical protein